MLQAPRRARTVREIEREMMLPTMVYKVPPNTAVSATEAYRVPPYGAKEEERKKVLGQIEGAIEKEHYMQETIDRSVGERQWGPGPEVLNSGIRGLGRRVIEDERSVNMREHEHLSERCAKKSTSKWEGGRW
jgi:hypothetical protein